ncbi:MAG: tyrosine-type recombinase/integrase [Coriobacteriales bacterium]|nr:tyrosine-type recombinase/integrase [Coriobacteriales bacterium]
MPTLRSGGRRIIPAFTEAEVRSIVGAIDASTAKGKRDRAVVLLAYCTGLRSRDILSLRLDEVD